MPAGVPSEAAGPAFLSILLLAACMIAWRRRRSPPAPGRLVSAACLALALQSLHVAEEFATGFHRRVPALLGLDPWSDGFFIWFNLAWIAIWCAAIAAAARRPSPPSLACLWFLALASAGNAIGHPLLSVMTGGYFPGLASAAAMSFTGPLLITRLLGNGGRRSEPPREGIGPIRMSAATRADPERVTQ